MKSLEIREKRAEYTRIAAATPAASKIFVSYRREDSTGQAGRIFDRLVARFGTAGVFMDIDTLAVGEDVTQAVNRMLADAMVMLVVIGRSWLTAADSAGRQRIDDPYDFVRVEIASALTQGTRVIPVLAGGATMPTPARLPADIAGLARRNAIEISDSRFVYDVDRLIDALERTMMTGLPERLTTDVASRRIRTDGIHRRRYRTGCTHIACALSLATVSLRHLPASARVFWPGSRLLS